jgi:hypothetical protein
MSGSRWAMPIRPSPPPALADTKGYSNTRPGHIPTPPRPRPVRARPGFPQSLAAPLLGDFGWVRSSVSVRQHEPHHRQKAGQSRYNHRNDQYAHDQTLLTETPLILAPRLFGGLSALACATLGASKSVTGPSIAATFRLGAVPTQIPRRKSNTRGAILPAIAAFPPCQPRFCRNHCQIIAWRRP